MAEAQGAVVDVKLDGAGAAAAVEAEPPRQVEGRARAPQHALPSPLSAERKAMPLSRCPWRPASWQRTWPAHDVGAQQLGAGAGEGAAPGCRRRRGRRPPASPAAPPSRLHAERTVKARLGAEAAAFAASASRVCRKSLKASRSGCATVKPAAMGWPPPLTSRPACRAAVTAAPISTPGTERHDALPIAVLPGDDDRRPVVALLEPARDDADDAGVPAPVMGEDQGRRRKNLRLLADSTCSMASSSTACSMAWRSRLSASRRRAISAASSSSAVVMSRAPRLASPTRPPALTRGPSMKPR